ncbi:class I SAM-dependent methyltransferase [Vagococcus bubulae]|uniref:Methyltransferase domain-containing protein n=1 Tax=Vagococcus bubulae TaxID=1977868 RepID=A0A429ZBU9_9ENTE|nr:class I SAM-dependent methyltransferase [Vagococcus bubulae]RST91170.1 hypothetical protein CBF36_10450 [Vagococcus bubulae]
MFKEYGPLSTMMYQKTKAVGQSLDGDIEYYYDFLQDVKGSILEAGVGTGRVLIPLLEKGLNVEGVDVSEDMLSQCKKNMEAYSVSTFVYQQDLFDLSLNQEYEAIIMPTGSFCLLEKDRIEKVLKGFYHCLSCKGKVILDLIVPNDFKKGKITQSKIDISNTETIIYTHYDESIDWISQQTTSIDKYELINEGKVVETEYSHFTLYWYGLKEFEWLIQSLGFKLIKYDDGYNRGVPGIVTAILEKQEE